MRKRYQKGSLRIDYNRKDPAWMLRYYEGSNRRHKTLGLVSRLTREQAEAKQKQFMDRINMKEGNIEGPMKFGEFVEGAYFPTFENEWKGSTESTNTNRIRVHLVEELEGRPLVEITRLVLQDLLNRKALSVGRSRLKAKKTLGRSMIKHLKWDLHKIFKLAIADGHVRSNPAGVLTIPKATRPPEPRREATKEELQLALSQLDLRDRIIVQLGLVESMRPEEIVALQLKHVHLHVDQSKINIDQRIYKESAAQKRKRALDRPKGLSGIDTRREIGLGETTAKMLAMWIDVLPDQSPDAWLFPSENGETPVSIGNVVRRNIKPRLKAVGLDWINFQVTRRTASSKGEKLKLDTKEMSDQFGHTAAVHQNVYSQTDIDRKCENVRKLERSLLQ